MDLHDKAFDEGTLVKLRLFRYYLESWLPTLVYNDFSRTINIFDFFSGPGGDVDGKPGSPLLALDVIESYADAIREKGVAVHLYLNDDNKEKVALLKARIDERMDGSALGDIVNIEITCDQFRAVFENYLPLMLPGGVANVLFLDQAGIREVTKDTFETITNLSVTDFMFFVASETIHRFGGAGQTKAHIDIPPAEIRALEHSNIHRKVTDYYRNLVPDGRKYFLAPFSIKKKDTGNIYGLVFGTQHLAGLDKFMRAAWKMDKDFGEANYDVDGENVEKGQMYIFEDMRRPTKEGLFKDALRAALAGREIATNRQLLEFALTSGFLSSHAKNAADELIEEGVLPKQRIAVSYSSCWKNEQAIEYN